MKKVFKIFILFFIIIILYGNNTFQYAKSKDLSLTEVITGADIAVKGGNSNTFQVNQEELKKDSASVFNTLLAIGVGITVIVGAYLGIKFIMASVEDKAKIKEMLIPYVIGCVVIYGAFTIWKITVVLLGQT